MRRWDRLLDAYVEEYRARGLSPQSVTYTQARLDRWGRWLKGRRPRVGIEHIDAEMITRYVASCSSFRAKATVYATLSTMRGFGDYLVRQGLWLINPLRWMKGPKEPCESTDARPDRSAAYRCRRWCCSVLMPICRFATTSWKRLHAVASVLCW